MVLEIFQFMKIIMPPMILVKLESVWNCLFCVMEQSISNRCLMNISQLGIRNPEMVICSVFVLMSNEIIVKLADILKQALFKPLNIKLFLLPH